MQGESGTPQKLGFPNSDKCLSLVLPGTRHCDHRVCEWEHDGSDRPQNRRHETHEGVSKDFNGRLSPHLSVNIDGKADLVSLPSVVDMSTWMGEMTNIDDNSSQGSSRGVHLHVREGDHCTDSGIQSRLAAGPWRKVVHNLLHLQDGITIIAGGVIVFWCLRLVYRY